MVLLLMMCTVSAVPSLPGFNLGKLFKA